MKKYIFLIILTLGLPFSTIGQNFYLNANGVTCMCPNAAIGETGVVNGITYTKRTTNQITGQNASTTCTSGITNMTGLLDNTIITGSINSWDVSNVTSMVRMFENSNYNQSLANWDVSNVTNMAAMFRNSPFNQPLSSWNVSNVTNMNSMFANSAFNQTLSSWDVSIVTNMNSMFSNSAYNQPIANWNVNSVNNMSKMFSETPFNQPIANWNVSNVTNMSQMFLGTPFNQPIANWNVNNVADMTEMFLGTPFNQPLESWNVSSVTNMSGMFWGSQFNQPIANWNVSNVTNMGFMFADSNYNQPLESWNVSNVINMSFMFNNSSFNKPLANWNLVNVDHLDNMFSNSSFNQPLSNWNVSNIFTMSNMFQNNTSFDQDISSWQFTNCVQLEGFLNNSGLSIANYDLLLNSLNNQNIPPLTLGALNLIYCNFADRNVLTNVKGWNIQGDTGIPTQVTSPNDIIITANEGLCEVTNIDLGTAIGQSCSGFTITNNAPSIFPKGNTIVTWTLTTDTGTIVTSNQNITVLIEVDNASICYVTSDTSEPNRNRIFINNVNGYNVLFHEFFKETSQGVYQSIGTINQNQNSIMDITSNNQAQSYKYLVKTTDICNNEISSLNAHKTILLQSNVAVNNSVNLNWSPYEGLSYGNYKIYRSINGGSFIEIANISSSSLAYNDISANVSNNNYEYYISIDIPDCSPNQGRAMENFLQNQIKSNIINTSSLGLSDQTLNLNLTIYPNPTNDLLNINIAETSVYIKSEIYNIIGQKVLETSEKTLNVSNLPNASYLLKILTLEGTVIKKIIKN